MTQNYIAVLLAATLANVTITRGSIFQGLRSRITNDFLSKLIGCHYCLGHWAGFTVTLVFGMTYTSYPVILDYLISCFTNAFVIVFISTVLVRLMWPEPNPIASLIRRRGE